jgi:hypothetical protein
MHIKLVDSNSTFAAINSDKAINIRTTVTDYRIDFIISYFIITNFSYSNHRKHYSVIRTHYFIIHIHFINFHIHYFVQDKNHYNYNYFRPRLSSFYQHLKF